MGRQQPRRGELLCHSAPREIIRLSENAHLPFDKLTALSKVDPSTKLRVDAEQGRSIEGLRYPCPPPC